MPKRFQNASIIPDSSSNHYAQNYASINTAPLIMTVICTWHLTPDCCHLHSLEEMHNHLSATNYMQLVLLNQHKGIHFGDKCLVNQTTSGPLCK